MLFGPAPSGTENEIAREGSTEMSGQVAHGKHLADAVVNRRTDDVRQRFRDAINAGTDATELAKQTNAALASFCTRVEFQDQPGNRWLIKITHSDRQTERVVVF
jgi:hypothetical protein